MHEARLQREHRLRGIPLDSAVSCVDSSHLRPGTLTLDTTVRKLYRGTSSTLVLGRHVRNNKTRVQTSSSLHSPSQTPSCILLRHNRQSLHKQRQCNPTQSISEARAPSPVTCTIHPCCRTRHKTCIAFHAMHVLCSRSSPTPRTSFCYTCPCNFCKIACKKSIGVRNANDCHRRFHALTFLQPCMRLLLYRRSQEVS